MDIPPVQVQMLGRFVIRRGSQEVSVSGRSQKLCLLLAALIWERDRPLSYHELTQLLWAETGHGPNPVNALKAILHRARLCLDGLGEGSGRSLLLHRDGGLQWSPQVPLTLDAEQFSLLTHEAGQPLGEDQALALQMEALSLYQGRLLPMLDGCTRPISRPCSARCPCWSASPGGRTRPRPPEPRWPWSPAGMICASGK